MRATFFANGSTKPQSIVSGSPMLQYVDRIAGLVEEIQGRHGSAWNMMLDLDLATFNPPHGTAVWKGIDMIPADRKARMQSILDRQPPKHLAMATAREWLSKRVDSPRPPTTHPDWAAIAEVSFRVGRWEIRGHIRDWLTAVDLNLVPEDLELRAIADLMMPMFRLTLDGSSPELGWLDHIWRPVTDEDWAATGVACWDTVEIADAKRFVEAIGAFKAMIDHLSGWLPLTEIEGIDGSVMQSYIARSQPQWSDVVQAFIDGCAGVASSFDALSDEARERRAYLAHAVATLSEHYHRLLPPGLGQEGGAELSTATCRDWVNAVHARREVLDTLSAAVIVDALSEAQLSA